MQEEVDKLKKEVDEKFKILLDKFDSCVFATRDSVSPSMSDILRSLIESDKNQNEKIDKIIETLTPISKKFAMVNGFGGTFLLIAKYAGAGAAIYFALKYFAEFIRKI